MMDLRQQMMGRAALVGAVLMSAPAAMAQPSTPVQAALRSGRTRIASRHRATAQCPLHHQGASKKPTLLMRSPLEDDLP